MNNNGMIEYKEGFISKIKKFFKRLFGKQEERYNYIQEEKSINEIKEERQEEQYSFANEIKVNKKSVDAVLEKNNFLKEIEGNEEALNMLSIDRLKKLEKYYDNIIEQNNEKIRKLKAFNN